MCNINHPKFPCKIYAKNVKDKDKAVHCDFCELWNHIKCNNFNYLDYRYLQNCDESWQSIECYSRIFPFNSLSSNKNFLACCANTDSNITQWKDLENDHDSSLPLKPSNLELLVNQFNNATPENGNDHEKLLYLNIMIYIDEMHNIEIPHKNKMLPLFHRETCFLNKKFDEP